MKKFIDMSEEHFDITNDGTKHCGGDGGLMEYFAKAVEDNEAVDKYIFKSHRAVMAAERARISGKCIEL